MVIGIAGNTGSGKTTVCKIFEEQGARVTSADELGWQIIKKGSKEYGKIVKEFGSDIVCSDGAIDRKKLGSLIFADPAKRTILNRIVHPRLIASLKDEIRKTREDDLLVIDAALIFDWGLEKELDLVVVVTAPEAVKIERLKRMGFTEAEARRRLQSQLPEEALVQKADITIDNTGSPEELKKKCREIIDAILKY